MVLCAPVKIVIRLWRFVICTNSLLGHLTHCEKKWSPLLLTAEDQVQIHKQKNQLTMHFQCWLYVKWINALLMKYFYKLVLPSIHMAVIFPRV